MSDLPIGSSATSKRVWTTVSGTIGKLDGFDAAFALAVAGWAAFVISVEPYWPFTWPVIGVFCGLTMLLFGLLRRIKLAFGLSAILFGAIYAAAGFKYSIVAMNLHVYDISFYLQSLSHVTFFFDTFPHEAWGLTAALVVAGAVLVVMYRAERPWRGGWMRQSAVALLAILFMAGSITPLLRNNVDFFSDHRSVFSAFLSSFHDLPELVQLNKIFQTTAQANTTAIPLDAITCTPDQTPPDIIYSLNESAMPPGVYPNLVYPKELDPFFQSYDGQIHPLRVETFGGGTWLSDFSALTGLSTNTFGTLRNFAVQIMTGRLRHSLPQYLKACGYETTLVFTVSADFAGANRFYQAIGFDHIIDRKVHHAPDDRQRDLFYYDQAAQALERAKAAGSRRPQFIAVSSMSTHTPWDFRFAKEMVKPTDELRWNRDVEFDEYLWRLVLAKRDRDEFRQRLAKEFPDRPFLFVGYGDHQPALGKIPLDDPVAIADGGKSWQLDPQSPAFRTYYEVDGLNFTPKAAMPDYPIVELPNLATITVLAAGLPLDPVYRRRVQLMKTCEGLFGTCADKGAMLTFQHWLVDAGWVTAAN